jgi:outer membrane immunogenic protein
MNRLLRTAVGMMGLAAPFASAWAADMPVKAPPKVTAVYQWTGFYVGGHVGAGWGTKVATTAPFPLGIAVVTPDVATNKLEGGLAGGQIGYNFQGGAGLLGGRWVIGIEADASWSRLKDTVACSAAAAIPGLGVLPIDGTCSSEVTSLGTIALRYGTAFDRLLVYGKLGAAWTRDNYLDVVATPAFAPLSFTAHETRWGWMTGTGVEYTLATQWSAKIEYNFMHLGTENVRYTIVPSGGLVNTDMKERVHVIKFGLNYRFELGAASSGY